MLRYLVGVLSVAAFLTGGTFFLQGIGVLPGSFMTGRVEWAVIGASFVVLSIAGLWLSWKARRARSTRLD